MNIRRADSEVETGRIGSMQEELRAFVHAEHTAQREHLKRLWEKPIEDRIEEGRCVTGAWIKELRAPNRLVLAVTGNDSRFREGDFVTLSQGDPNLPLCEAVVIESEDEHIEIQIRGREITKLNLPDGFRGLQLDESSIDMERFFLSAIEDLAKKAIGREKILPLLDGTLKPKLDVEQFDVAEGDAKERGFEEEQAKAVASALATDLCWLIHGPPGTGKTRVLAWIVNELLKKGERVLVTSATHRTINNLLEAIAEISGDRSRLAKIAPFRERSLSVEQYEGFADTPFRASASGYVIGATPFALRTKRLSGVDFDTVIIDEASQVTLPLAVMAMLAGQRFIFAGDHRQLPPVCLSLSPSESARASIFGRLVGRGMDTMLTVTYRLNEPLCEWPSESFYVSRLRPTPTAAVRRLVLGGCPSEFTDLLAPEPCTIWACVPHSGSRSYSPEEVEVLASILLKLREVGYGWKDVGVVVPFRRQARALRQRLTRQLKASPSAAGLVADTVERMQGQEREIMIVSFAVSDSMFAERLVEFLFQPERLNVAATRARSKLILVASPDLVEFAKSPRFEGLCNPFVSLFSRAHRIEIGASP